jgi:UDP-2,3-diacylglucosamine pyrophosphatase LpxH
MVDEEEWSRRLDDVVRAAGWLAQRGMKVSRNNFREALLAVDAATKNERILQRWGWTWQDLRTWMRGHGPSPEGGPREVWRGGMVTTPSGESRRGVGRQPRERLDEGREVWDRLAAHHRGTRDRHEDSSTHTVHCGDGPVGVFLMGDVHVGSPATDYDRLRWVTEQVNREDIDLYCAQIGDLMDAMVLSWARHALANQRSSIPEQCSAAAWWLASVRDRMVGLVSGNHDAWSAKQVGVNLLDHVLAQAGAHTVAYHPIELTVYLEVGKHTYSIRLRHKVRGQSMYNPAHGVGRHVRFNLRDEVDVLVAGHTHRSGVQRISHQSGSTYACQVGTYKREELDSYAATEGFAPENRSPEMLAVFEPDERRVHVFEDSDVGMIFLEDRTRAAGKVR